MRKSMYMGNKIRDEFDSSRRRLSGGNGVNLFVAAMRNDVKELERAISQGQDINEIVDAATRRTPLHVAAIFGSFEFIARACAEKQIRAHVFDAYGFTPYLYSSNRNDTEAKKILFALTHFEITGPEQTK